jgi:hypothetical protein
VTVHQVQSAIRAHDEVMARRREADRAVTERLSLLRRLNGHCRRAAEDLRQPDRFDWIR